MLACLSTSCATNWHVTNNHNAKIVSSNVCLNIPSEYVQDASSAISAWNFALNGFITLVPTTDSKECEFNVYVVDDPEPGVDDDAAAYVSNLGDKTIRLVKNRYESNVKGILLHELGHSLGAGHVVGTLMDPYIHPSLMRCPDEITVKQVAKSNNISWNSLNWCEL